MNNSVRVELDCGHVRWFKRAHAPDLNDVLWCVSCDRYQPLAPAESAKARTYQEDFWSEPLGAGYYQGGCTYESCNFVVARTRNWFTLRDTMHSHFMKQHTRFGSKLEIKSVPFYPSDATPPF